jgi:hypothetical protein
MSVLSPRFLPVEQAVRTILGQVRVEPAVAEELVRRAGKDGHLLPADILDRIGYVFAGDG